MFRYLTNYRFYTMAKCGFGLAYLWYVWDFLRIHLAIWNQLSYLLPPPSDIAFSGNPHWDIYLRSLAIFMNGKTVVWVFCLASPFAVVLFIWGRHRRLQMAVGCWMSFSMISLNALIGVFTSTADIWLNLAFVFYSLTALISSTAEWEKNEPGFNFGKWRADPALNSVYAWLIVLLQFSVYFFAGINKLVDGWQPWTTGVALQNLAFDSSMHEFARGTQVPYWISLILCYVTLLQRLVVPFAFYFQRYRFWSVLILGSMHIGYAILMYVNIFPLIGMASLLMVLPPRTGPQIEAPLVPLAKAKSKLNCGSRPSSIQKGVIYICAAWLLLESARLTVFKPTPWENKLMIVPAWRMFADGGVSAGGKWRLVLDTPRGDVDATDIPLRLLPQIWRDRFYIDTIFHDIEGNNVGTNSLVCRLLAETERAYGVQQVQISGDPAVLGSAFDIYRRKSGVETK